MLGNSFGNICLHQSHWCWSCFGWLVEFDFVSADFCIAFYYKSITMASKVGKVVNAGKALKELRIHLCPNSQSSSGVR